MSMFLLWYKTKFILFFISYFAQTYKTWEVTKHLHYYITEELFPLVVF